MEPEGREDSSGRRLSERWRLPALGSAGRRGLVGWGHPGFRFRWWLHLSIAFQVRTQTRADYQAVGHMPHHRALRPGSGLSLHAATGRMAGCVSLPSSAVGTAEGNAPVSREQHRGTGSTLVSAVTHASRGLRPIPRDRIASGHELRALGQQAASPASRGGHGGRAWWAAWWLPQMRVVHLGLLGFPRENSTVFGRGAGVFLRNS